MNRLFKSYLNFSNFIGPAFAAVLSIIFCLSIYLCTFKNFPFPVCAELYLIFFITALLLSILLVIVWQKFGFSKIKNKLNNNNSFRISIIIFILFFVLFSFLMLLNVVYVYPGDAHNLTFGGFTEAESYSDKYSSWFNNLPDRLFLGGLFIRLYWAVKFVFNLPFTWGLIDFSVSQSILVAACLFAVIFVSCLCVMFAILLLALSIKNKFSYLAGIISLFIGVLLIGINPLILTPYSDTYSMLFIALILWAYTGNLKGWVKWSVILGSSVIAFAIKPTAIFVIFAIALIQFSKLNFWKNVIVSFKQNYKDILKCVCCFLLSVFIVIVVSDFGLNRDYEKQFTWTHFLSIGMNYESTGYWTEDKVKISEACDNIEDRQTANLNEVKREISSMGPVGLIDLVIRKTVRNFNDGTFGYAYWTWICGHNLRSGVQFLWDEFLKPFYGISELNEQYDRQNNQDSADYYCPYILFEEVLWIIVLLFCIPASIFYRKRTEIKAITLAILLITLFLAIFEANARYLYMFTPLFLYLSICGFYSLNLKFKIQNSKLSLRQQFNNE